MDKLDQMLKTTVEELDRLLNARNVLGDPIERDGATIIPIVSFGFAFGAGGGDGPTTGSAGSTGAGAGAGGGIKPVGAIILDKDGARVEGIQTQVSEVLRTVGAAAVNALDRAARRRTGGAADAPGSGAAGGTGNGPPGGTP